MGTKIVLALRCTLLISAAFLFSGCATKLAYNHLDWAIGWKVKRLVDLEGAQKEQVRQSIRDFHAWHRQTQLPQYAAYLSAVKTRMAKGNVSATDVAAEIGNIQTFIDQSIAQVLPDAVDVLSQLSQADTDELLNSISEEREEYIEERIEVSKAERRKQRYEKFEKHFKTWLGSPSKKQKKQIKQWAASLEPYEPLMAKQQLAWQQRLDEVLAQRENKTALTQGLQALVFHRTDGWDKKLAHIVDNNQQRTYFLIADILNNMSDKQRRHLNQTIDDYVKIFNELHAAG